MTQKRDVEEIKAVKKEAVERYESVLNLVTDWPEYKKNWKPDVKLEAEEKDKDGSGHQELNLFKRHYLEIKVEEIVTKLRDSNNQGYVLLFDNSLEIKGEEIDSLWLSKDVANAIGINNEINYRSNPKEFYLLKDFIIDRIKDDKTKAIIGFWRQRIITKEEYQKLRA
ncbi:hypothetical protein [endosymbiont GvMRE of Glomus versiforme]|uniref:hypothetical protein n=1 Tax=endosymbiont GvMRE of Glomus versiforme TaxID=2039283 RepID=UPI0011C4A9C4|nr:hypothetical protein [endosymbiont GvMRE of Glomus versiforme]